jgi:hypothetical protein
MWHLWGMKNLKIDEYFPKSYSNSRQRFLEQASQIHEACQIGYWAVPSKSDTDLFVDYLWLAPTDKTVKPEKCFVITSGIHGSEGYAGSAIQSMFLSEILPRIDRRRTGFLVVHAMNPYGFKHHRRCTENNINLNRNFSVSGEIFKRDCSESTRMSQLFLTRSPVSSKESFLLKSKHILAEKVWFGDFSMDQVVKAVSPGQFRNPEDLEYGGKCLEPQSLNLIEMMRTVMGPFKDIIGFDLHTGLGDRGRLHLLTDGSNTGVDQGLFNELFKPKQDQNIYVFTPSDEEGFYEVHGSLNSVFADLKIKDQRVCSITMEFGTLGHSLEAQVAGWNSFVLDHEGHFYGFADSDLKNQITTENFERSYPNDHQWRHDVITAARGLFESVLMRAKLL